MIFFVCLVSLIFPLILIPIEKIAPYPFVIEEIAKASLIFIILKNSLPKHQLKLAIMMAFLFALTENLFYLINFIVDGVLYSFIQRFILTTTLHILTAIIILLPAQKKSSLIILGFVLAVMVHYLYNQIVLFLFVA